MSKGSRLYKIFITSMIVIIAGMLLATGIIAIQKQMKLKTSFDYIPGVDVEVFVKNDDNPTEKLIFSNYANGTNRIYVDTTYCSLSATTLTFNNAFVTAYGNNFSLVVYNYSNFTISTEITSTTTAKVGENTVEAVEPEITPATSQIETGESGEFVISCEPIIPQETIISIQFEEYIPTYWEEDGYTIRTYGTEGAVAANRAYYAENLHYKYYIEMGEYPQTGADSTTEDYLDSNYASLSTDANGYYTYNGAKYARVASPNTSYSADSNVNFYKVEPVRWIVLGGVTSTTDGSSAVAFNPTNDVTYNSTNKTFTYSGTAYSKVLLIAEQALKNNVYDSNSSDKAWKNTRIYSFLNTTLMPTIFTETQQNKILGTTLYTGRYSVGGNGGSSTSPNTGNGTSTANKLFLLGAGRDESTDGDAGYTNYAKENYRVSTYFRDRTARYGGKSVANVTDYARASGAYWDNNYKFSSWWLRSGLYSGNYYAYYVNVAGLNHDRVNYSNCAVRPSFILNLA